MTPHRAALEHCVPWRVLMLTPSGHVEVVEVRSGNAALALDTVQGWKPCHRVATDRRGNPLISSVAGRPKEGFDAYSPTKREGA